MQEIVPAEFCAETIALKKTIESGFLVLGERLSKIKEDQLWMSHWESFAQFLDEMDINEGTASRLVTVYKTYVEGYHIDNEILAKKGWATLYELKSIVPDNATQAEVLAIVERSDQLSRDDIREMIRETKHGECIHDWYTLHIKQCRTCAKRESLE